MIRVLYIGDVVGQPGRRALHDRLEHVVDRDKIDFTIVNIENAAGGFGVTEAIIEELSELPIQAFTSGNHIWDKKEFVDNYEHYEHVIRPANYPAGNPGKGWVVRQTAAGDSVAVLQLMGNIFMPPCDNPFHCADRVLPEITAKVIIVDIHGEATSEKQAMGHFCDGRASLVVGTHTHAPTADHQILSGGTGYISDVGMSGDYDSVIGMAKDEPLNRFVRRIPSGRFEPALGAATLCAVALETDDATGLARAIGAVRLGGRLEQARPAFWAAGAA